MTTLSTTLSTTQWSIPAWAVLAAAALAAVLIAVAIGLAVSAARSRSRARSVVATLAARVDEMQARLDAGADPLRSTGATSGRPKSADEFVITSLGELPDSSAQGSTAVSLSAPAFADAVLRESAVHTVSLVHGVRRALAPEVRNRIWFEMRRELKRSRKERKVELREALREYRARHRADVPADGAA